MPKHKLQSDQRKAKRLEAEVAALRAALDAVDRFHLDLLGLLETGDADDRQQAIEALAATLDWPRC
jgi:hypothetical protein